MLTDATALRHLLFGALYAGSLLQLDNFHLLPQLMMLQLGEWFEVVATALSRLHLAMEPQSDHTRTEPDDGRSTSAPPQKGVTPSNFETIPEMSSSTIGQQEMKSPSVDWTPSIPASHNPIKTTRSNSMMSHQSSRQSHMFDHTHTRSTATASRATTRLDWYQLLQETKPEDMSLSSWFGYGGQIRRDVEMDDCTILKVSPAFGCILVGESKAQSIPEQLKVCRYEFDWLRDVSLYIPQSNFRPVSVLQPDLTYLCEALLVSHCFSEAHELGYIISRFMKQLQQQVCKFMDIHALPLL